MCVLLYILKDLKLNYPPISTGSTLEVSKLSQRFWLQVSVVGGLRSWFVLCNQTCDSFLTKIHVMGNKETIEKSTP